VIAEARRFEPPLLIDGPAGDPRVAAFCRLSGAARPFVLSNFARQQPLVRLLVAISSLTGDDTFETVAREVAAFMFERFTDSRGLLAWGGHVAVALPDAEVAYERVKGPVHELKYVFPCYDFLWTVDARATARLIEAFWNAHVLDWSRLDFNRHGRYHTPLGALWESTYAGRPVFFWGDGLTFASAGCDLYYAAATLARLSGEARPLTWATRLAGRYVETRQQPIGISGYQFSQCATAWCDGPGVRGDRAQYAYGDLIPDGHVVYEGTRFTPRPVVQRCQLALGAELGSAGDAFTTWAVEELLAWARVAYRPADNAFIPMLTDGYSLEGLAMTRDGYFGPRGRVDTAMPADAEFLWTYARAYRETGDDRLWQMVRAIAHGNGLGDVGDPAGIGTELAPARLTDRRVLHAWLDLYAATGRRAYLDAAIRIADAIVDRVEHRQPVLTPGDDDIESVARVMLTLVSLAAVLTDRATDLPLIFS
jgi:pectate lyase